MNENVSGNIVQMSNDLLSSPSMRVSQPTSQSFYYSSPPADLHGMGSSGDYSSGGEFQNNSSLVITHSLPAALQSPTGSSNLSPLSTTATASGRHKRMFSNVEFVEEDGNRSSNMTPTPTSTHSRKNTFFSGDLNVSTDSDGQPLPRKGSVAFSIYRTPDKQTQSQLGKLVRKEAQNRSVLEVYLRNEYAVKMNKVLYNRRLLLLFLDMDRKLFHLVSSIENYERLRMLEWETLDHFDLSQEFFRLNIRHEHERSLETDFKRDLEESLEFMEAHERQKARWGIERQENRERRFMCRDRDLAEQWLWYTFSCEYLERVVSPQYLYHLGIMTQAEGLFHAERCARESILVEMSHGRSSIIMDAYCDSIYPCVEIKFLSVLQFQMENAFNTDVSRMLIARVTRAFGARRFLCRRRPQIRLTNAMTFIHSVVKSYFVRQFVYTKLTRRQQISLRVSQTSK